MKTIIVCFSLAALLHGVASNVGAEIMAGPVVNPANGHLYYLLAPDTWSAAEAEAENLGGTLAVIKNAAEQSWIFSTFGDYGGTNRSLWIGFHRQWPGGPFAWVTDEKSDFVNWAPGEPNNANGVESCVEMWPGDNHGLWNDCVDSDLLHGVVEVPGKSNGKALTGQEKSLIGVWYNNGDTKQTCWITCTDHLLFAVDQNKCASRIIYTTEGLLFFSNWKQHAEVVQDKILWSRGNWWSRTPAEYKTAGKPSESDSTSIDSPGTMSSLAAK